MQIKINNDIKLPKDFYYFIHFYKSLPLSFLHYNPSWWPLEPAGILHHMIEAFDNETNFLINDTVSNQTLIPLWKSSTSNHTWYYTYSQNEDEFKVISIKRDRNGSLTYAEEGSSIFYAFRKWIELHYESLLVLLSQENDPTKMDRIIEKKDMISDIRLQLIDISTKDRIEIGKEYVEKYSA